MHAFLTIANSGQKTSRRPKDCTYVLQQDDGSYLNANKAGNIAAMCGHSCEPNCELRRIEIGKTTTYNIVPETNIQPGVHAQLVVPIVCMTMLISLFYVCTYMSNVNRA